MSLVDLTEPSDPLNYKSVYKNWILQIILHVFYGLYLCGTKSFVLKTELFFTFFWYGLVWHLVL